jgi:micrococcal nuclease
VPRIAVHVAAAVALLLVGSTVAQAREWAGTVTHVTDGDTVWVRPDGEGRARPLKLRLDGIDAPERCQAWGPQATAALAGRVLHRRVSVDSRATDDHGRLLGRLGLGGDDVGAWMVRQGHAWSYRYRRSEGPYAGQEAGARAGRRGLFADPSAQEPRWFRRDHGPCDRPPTAG